MLDSYSHNLSDDPAVGGILVSVQDLTIQSNLARTIRTLTQANHVLIHATNESALLSDLCDTIVEVGEYLLAYVCYVEHDAAKTMRPVACAGRTAYLDGIQISWDDNEFGTGPTGTAVRTGVEQIVDDIRDSSGSATWRDRAEKNGLRSACVFPLVVDSVIIGSLTICTGEPESFTSKEVTLLRELADDLAYGIGQLRDAERLVRNEAHLRYAERMAHVGHWEWDIASDNFEFMADEMFAIYGITAGEWRGTLEAFLAFVPASKRAKVTAAIKRAISDGSAEVKHCILRPDGQIRHVRMRAETVRGNDGTPVRMVGISLDVTEQMIAEQELEHSRKFLLTITDNMAEGMIATDSEGIVTFVNASAARLLGTGTSDLMSRPSQSVMTLQQVDGTLYPTDEFPLSAVWADGQSLMVDNQTILRRDGTSVPIAYSATPLKTDKLSGAVIVFEDITERAAEQLKVNRELRKLAWVGRIRDGLDDSRFVLFAQPIMDLTTSEVIQHELLIRLIGNDGTIIPPDKFLPAAEEYGLISEIDRWVVGETARLAAQGHRLEFNLSAKSVVDANMLTVIQTAIEESGASPENLICEITETALVRDIATAEKFVRGLNDMGVKVALDDFGAGYGGFAYLKRLPVAYLKIDQEFVHDLVDETSSRHVVSAVVSLAKAFGMQTIAEGAEDAATMQVLKDLHVDHVQGYVIGRPAPWAEVLDANSL